MDLPNRFLAGIYSAASFINAAGRDHKEKKKKKDQ